MGRSRTASTPGMAGAPSARCAVRTACSMCGRDDMDGIRLYRVWRGSHDGWIISARSVDEALRLARELFPNADQVQPVASPGGENDSLRDMMDRGAAVAAMARDRISADTPARVCGWRVMRHGEVAYTSLPEYHLWWEMP